MPRGARRNEAQGCDCSACGKPFVIPAVTTLYFNFFVLIAQTFAKMPAAHALAPTGAEPPFAIAQGIALAVFIVIGVMAVRRFRPA